MAIKILDPHAKLALAEKQYRRALRMANNASTLFQDEANRQLAEARQSLRVARMVVRNEGPFKVAK